MGRAGRQCLAVAICAATTVCSHGPTNPSPVPSTHVTLTGIVRESVTMTPMQNVRISIAVGTNAGRETVSNSAGVYTLTDLTPGAMTLQFTSPGYLDLRRTEVIDRDTTLDVVLSPQSTDRLTLTGHVSSITEEGAVVRDVRVAIVSGVNAGRETATDAAGAYGLIDLVPGSMTLEFTKFGYEDLRRTENVQTDMTLDVPLLLRPERYVLSGRITELWGTPIGDVGVEVVHEGRVIGGGATHNGVYSIPTLPAWDYIVRTEKWGYEYPTEVPLHLTGDTTLDITLKRTRVEISGYIEEAQPCTADIMDVRVEIVDGPDAGLATMSGPGGYSLKNVNWGTFTLRASKTGYITQTVSMNVLPPGSGSPPASSVVRQSFRLQRVSGPAC